MPSNVNTYYWAGGNGSFGAAASWNVRINDGTGHDIFWPADQNYIYGGQTLYMASQPNASSILVFNAGGNVIGSGSALYAQINADLTIDATTSTQMEVGVTAPGTVRVDGGSWVSTNVEIGVGSAGSVFVSDHGLMSADGIDVGDTSAGTLSITGGATVAASSLRLGTASNGSADPAGLVVLDAGTLTASGYVDPVLGVMPGLVDINLGTLDLAGGAVVSIGALWIGVAARDSVGVVKVEDGYLSVAPGATINPYHYNDPGSIELGGTLLVGQDGEVAAVGIQVSGQQTFYDGTGAVSFVAGPGSLSIDGGSVAVTGSLGIDAGGVVSGHGHITGTIANYSTLSAEGGTLVLDGPVFGGGVIRINQDSGTLVLNGAVGSGEIIKLAPPEGTSQVGTGLTIGDINLFHGQISGFAEGDTIDLAHVPFPSDSGQGLLPDFDGDSGNLVIESVVYGDTTTVVGTIDFTGWTEEPGFALRSDGAGGTDITWGVPEPDLPTLAALANEAYNTATDAVAGTVVAGYTLEYRPEFDEAGLLADAFVDGNQVVVAIRGTFPKLSVALGKNLLADASWGAGALNLADGTPNRILQTEVGDAASFLAAVREALPEAEITLTGHSLGGAIAQLLGIASGYTSVGFNAPGADQFEKNLKDAGLLMPAVDAGDGLARQSENFRMAGDQVSLAGDDIGTQWTIPSTMPDTWLNAFANHSMTTVLSAIKNDPVSFTSGAVPDAHEAPLSLTSLILPTASVVQDAVKLLGLDFVVDTAVIIGSGLAGIIAALYHIDPDGALSYELVADAGSPTFSGFSLPVYTDVASYSVSLLVDGSWQLSQSVAPGDVIAAPTGDTGIRYAAVDDHDQPVILPDGYIVGAAFATVGHFQGTLTEDLACFRRGTTIMTPDGPVAVEALRAGDRVIAKDGSIRPVIWIGFRDVDCSCYPCPRDVWPVRIQRHAFAPGKPYRDVWLSPDHAVFVDGTLIPIRYLLNGSTITQETARKATYFHVELDRHDVILAEGLPCESYLDTGNRAAFSNGGPTVAMHPDFALQVWERQSCAPLVRDGVTLAATHRLLLDRAAMLGHTLTDDADLRLLVDGRTVLPQVDGAMHRFTVPAGADSVRLVSRSAVPAHVHTDSPDHRRLGVAISRLTMDGRAIELADPRLSSGWHDVEIGWRWTDGDAGLALAGARVLEVEVAMTERYWLNPQPTAEGRPLLRQRGRRQMRRRIHP